MIISYLIIMIIHHENSSLIHTNGHFGATFGASMSPLALALALAFLLALALALGSGVAWRDTAIFSGSGGAIFHVAHGITAWKISFLHVFTTYKYHITITYIYIYIYIYQIYGINTYKHDWFCWISLGLSSLSSLSIAVSPRVHHVWRSHLSHLSPSEISVSTRFKNQLWTAIATAISTHHNTWKRSHHPNRSPSLETKPSFLASAASTVLASAVWGSATLGRNDHLGEPSPCHVLLGKCWVNVGKWW